jgi:hypothetical protein
MHPSLHAVCQQRREGDVETVRRSCNKGRDGEWLRVKRHDYHAADVRSVAELSGLVIDLADLSDAAQRSSP